MKRRLFGLELALLRRKLKETHKGMARKFGITEKQYEDLEAAQHVPLSDLWMKVVEGSGLHWESYEMTTWVNEETVDLILGRGKAQ